MLVGKYTAAMYVSACMEFRRAPISFANAVIYIYNTTEQAGYLSIANRIFPSVGIEKNIA